MQWFCGAILACLTVLPAHAGVIDVSAQTTQALQPGDVLSFLISDGSFSLHAVNMGLAAAPTDISFDFTSLPAALGQFTAVLESVDGGTQAGFSQPAYWQSGTFSGSGYQGPVSVLSGSIHLTAAVSQQVFSNSGALLELSYTGPDETIGLSPYTLRQDMTVSLSGGPLDMGAPTQRVTFSDFLSENGMPSSSNLSGDLSGDQSNSLDSGFATPEPLSGAILLAGGALLCMVGRLLNRFSHGNI